MERQIQYNIGVTFGCDPEGFLERDGKIIGAEKAIPTTGLGYNGLPAAPDKRVVLDGVQFEIHPSPHTCREGMAQDIAQCIQSLYRNLQTKDSAIKIVFPGTITMDPDELMSLSDGARILGCQPSYNAYEPPSNLERPKDYPIRSGGGHLHLGLSDVSVLYGSQANLAKILDVFVGNTFVLIDRDPRAAERRLTYGRAGEYRTPKHGLEYRTLSNFWMRHYVLQSGVMATARWAVQVWGNKFSRVDYSGYKLGPWDTEEALYKLVNIDKVRTAINTNDADLAWENWEGVKEFIYKHGCKSVMSGFYADLIKPFEWFAKNVQERGIEHFFPEDPMTFWVKGPTIGCGWERFIGEQVPQMMSADKTVTAATALRDKMKTKKEVGSASSGRTQAKKVA